MVFFVCLFVSYHCKQASLDLPIFLRFFKISYSILLYFFDYLILFFNFRCIFFCKKVHTNCTWYKSSHLTDHSTSESRQYGMSVGFWTVLRLGFAHFDVDFLKMRSSIHSIQYRLWVYYPIIEFPSLLLLSCYALDVF